mmetsp:Transcript_15765/g.31720  ORF Transcript_15765/g.31720 Transcript_15765/m.31720 type:complete len:203 (+) Transcript_15765:858-1466(+)
MGVADVTSKDIPSSDTTVVGTLGRWFTVRGKAEGLSRLWVKHEVLLFNAEPRFVSASNGHDAIAGITLIGGNGFTPRRVTVTQHQDVVSKSEGILEDCLGLQNYLRVLSWSLTCARTVIVPLRKLRSICNWFKHGPPLRPHLVEAVNPDVFCNVRRLRQRQVLEHLHLLRQNKKKKKKKRKENRTTRTHWPTRCSSTLNLLL